MIKITYRSYDYDQTLATLGAVALALSVVCIAYY